MKFIFLFELFADLFVEKQGVQAVFVHQLVLVVAPEAKQGRMAQLAGGQVMRLRIIDNMVAVPVFKSIYPELQGFSVADTPESSRGAGFAEAEAYNKIRTVMGHCRI